MGQFNGLYPKHNSHRGGKLMALTITENMRYTEGGKAWRFFTVLHDSGTTKTLSAASIDLTQIDVIVGTHTVMSMVAVASNVIDLLHVSITAERTALEWVSTVLGTQQITVIGY